jgi:hypothetical protein
VARIVFVFMDLGAQGAALWAGGAMPTIIAAIIHVVIGLVRGLCPGCVWMKAFMWRSCRCRRPLVELMRCFPDWCLICVWGPRSGDMPLAARVYGVAQRWCAKATLHAP